jgi:carboxyl-terminal processing protease
MKIIKSKAMLYLVAGLMLWILLASACTSGFAIGNRAAATPTPTVMPVSNVDVNDPNSELFAAFWQAWQLVHDKYVDQPVDDEVLMRGAIKGMLEALGDEHSAYMDPFEYKDANAALQGEYEGIGAWVNTDGEYLTISEPMPGSPAETAGLKPGDQIIAIDGEDMTGTLPELARRKVLGEKGTKVVLTILRDGEEQPFDVEVTRASITTPSVTSKMLDSNVAYVHLYTFGENTTRELRTALDTLLAQKPVGLILDLRNNGGGYLQTGIEVASEFVDQGVIVIEESGDGTREDFNALPGGKATEIPLVVLVNKYSASASEIVAGAIQDHGRAKLVGETTYGKGSVQSWIGLVDDQGAVRITIARWLTPNGRLIHKLGLTPDVEVAQTEADTQAEIDTQLGKAVELLTQP